jgi:DNA-binding transcriptional LysR family regulator
VEATLDLPALRAYVAVVRAGSFTRAAEQLDTQKAHLSRVVRRLEDQLGVQLLQRSTRSMTITEVGRELFERAVSVITAVEETERAIAQTRSEPRGVLKLTCGVEFGELVVNRWIADFLHDHPRMRVDAELTNRVIDLVHEGFDLAIRVGTLPDSALSARRLGEITYAFYASPKYLAKRKKPKLPRDLAQHDLVVFGTTPSPQWNLRCGQEQATVRPNARYRVNHNLAARDAIAAGLGVGMLPEFQAAPLLQAGKLVTVLDGWTREPVPVHAVFASGRYLAPKVRAFVEHARKRFAKTVA